MNPRPVAKAIREVLTSSSLSNPADVAAKVAEQIPDAQLRAALAEVLPSFVRTEFSRERMLSPVRHSGGPSAKVAAIRDAWAARKQTPLKIGDEYKRLAECTAADLLVAASELRQRADAMLGKADYYEALAAALPPGATVDSFASDPVAVAA